MPLTDTCEPPQRGSALGLEAASRGASLAVLVELERARLPVIEANIAKVRRTGAPGTIVLKTADATRPESYLAEGETYDLVFADPPYASGFSAFQKLAAGAGEGAFPAFPGARVLWELPDAPGRAGNFIEFVQQRGAKWKLRRFGGTDFLWIGE